MQYQKIIYSRDKLEAERIFLQTLTDEGYVITSEIMSFWQGNLFGPPDVLLQAEVQRAKRKTNERKTRPEHSLGGSVR